MIMSGFINKQREAGKPFPRRRQKMEASEAAPTRPSGPSSPSPSPTPSSLRQWRPAAQRNLRNQWSRLSAAKKRWLEAAYAGRSQSALLVNSYVSRRDMPGTDLGVLKDMPGIRDRANAKLARRQEHYGDMLLSSYREMVIALSDLIKASRSMRCYSKTSTNSSIVQFTDLQDDLNDSGDGGGIPIFKWFSVLEFENLAQELVDMFVSELHLKRLLVLEFLSIKLKEGAEEHHTSLEWSDELYDGEFNEFRSIDLQSGENCPLPENWSADVSQARRPGHTPPHEVLQVYLTSWLSYVNINTSRIDEIFQHVEEEMQIKFC